MTDFSPELTDIFTSHYVYCAVLLTCIALKLWQLLTFPSIVLLLKGYMYFCVSALPVYIVIVVQSLSPV